MVPLVPTANRREPVLVRWGRSWKVAVRVDQVRAVEEVRMMPPRLLPDQFPLTLLIWHVITTGNRRTSAGMPGA